MFPSGAFWRALDTCRCPVPEAPPVARMVLPLRLGGRVLPARLSLWRPVQTRRGWSVAVGASPLYEAVCLEGRTSLGALMEASHVLAFLMDISVDVEPTEPGESSPTAIEFQSNAPTTPRRHGAPSFEPLAWSDAVSVERSSYVIGCPYPDPLDGDTCRCPILEHGVPAAARALDPLFSIVFACRKIELRTDWVWD